MPEPCEATQETDVFAGSKAGRAEPSKSFDTGHRVGRFSIYSAELRSCFGPVFLHYALIPPFGNGDVHSVPLYVGSV